MDTSLTSKYLTADQMATYVGLPVFGKQLIDSLIERVDNLADEAAKKDVQLLSLHAKLKDSKEALKLLLHDAEAIASVIRPLQNAEGIVKARVILREKPGVRGYQHVSSGSIRLIVDGVAWLQNVLGDWVMSFRSAADIESDKVAFTLLNEAETKSLYVDFLKHEAAKS